MDTALQGFTARQAAFIVEYAASDNMSRACAAAGVCRGTGYSWLAKREFIDAVQQTRSQAVSSAWTSLSAGLQAAVDTVVGVLNSSTATTNAKLRAADMIMTQAQMLLEKQEIIARLDRLEGTIGEHEYTA